ncbi:MAG: hypothetical protein IT192_03490 [Microbacteriaceae bacterium]|nr:hypothetical protein [Cryobacterium sp.]MCC7127867.1 hypothetical protein [Microbacteriaceae bacterium]
MKKSAALTGASVIGAGLAAISVTPAQAAPVSTPACAGLSDQTVTVGNLDTEWFMDCVPQYGVGKVEFELNPAEPLPSGFLPLDDPGVTSVFSGNGPAAAAYYGVSGVPNGFRDLSEDGDELHYQGSAIVKVASVEAIDPLTLPAGCGTLSDFAHAYRVDYTPTTVTFTQQVDGKEWKTVISVTPSPVYLGYNFTPTDPQNPDPATSDGTFDVDKPQCLVIGPSISAGSDNQDPNWDRATNWALNLGSGAPSVWPYVPIDSPYFALGAFDLSGTPILAATGVDPIPFVIAGGVLVVGGGGFLIFATRKRREGKAKDRPKAAAS